MRAMTFGAVLLPCLAQLHPALCAAAPPAKKAPVSSMQEVTAKLSSDEPEEVRSALERAALLPPKQGIDLVAARVREGLPPALLDVAIDSLILLGDASAGPLLDDLARHRRSAVRQRAVEAAAQLRARGAEALLTRALDDPAPEVRGAAVEGLGTLGARESFRQLMRALELGVDGSALALGRIAGADQVGSLLDLIGARPLEPLSPMIEALLTRRDLPDADKLRVVERLAEIGTEPVRNMLGELVPKLPRETSARLRKAITDVIEADAKGAT